MTNSIYRDFYAGQTYIQANLWLNGGLAAVPLAAEFTLSANVDIPFITSESNIGLETDQATTPIQTDGRGLYASNKIQALFVKKQLGA
jgi:hypothetical protein